MREIPKVSYEGMFLFPQSASADLNGTLNTVRDLLAKSGAEIISLKKWADRPLAYPINKQKRGVYVLCYFTVSTDKLAEIERSCNLNEQLLRHLILRVDHMTLDEMKAADAQVEAATEAALRRQESEEGVEV